MKCFLVHLANVSDCCLEFVIKLQYYILPVYVVNVKESNKFMFLVEDNYI